MEKRRSRSELLVTLPGEMVDDILLCLPPKSLQRFKLVSKSWCSLISDPNFVQSHFHRVNKIISQGKHKAADILRVGRLTSTVDFPGHLRLSLYSTDSQGSNSDLVRVIYDYEGYEPCSDAVVDSRILGTCNGLLLINIVTHDSEKCILWNPSNRKYKTIASPDHIPVAEDIILSGFGYESTSRTYKAVLVSRSIYSGYGKLCLVYNYEKNLWTEKDENDADLFEFSDSNWPIMVNGVPHWCVFGVDTQQIGRNYLIVYFDLENENFKEVALPKWKTAEMKFDLGVLGGCLTMSVIPRESLRTTEIWAMKEYGRSESWTKLFVIPFSCRILKPLCFTGKNRVLLMQMDKKKGIGREKLINFNLEENTKRVLLANNNLSGQIINLCTYEPSLVSP